MLSPLSMLVKELKRENREIRETTPLTIRDPFCRAHPIHV
jgi:hypothetical protein